MKKISLEQANALLKNLGQAVQVVASDEGVDTELDIEAFSEEAEQAIINANMPSIKQTLTDEISSAKQAEIGAMERRSAAKFLGVKQSDLKDKNLSELFQMVADNASKKGDDTANDYTERIQRMQEDFDSQKTEWEGQLAAAHRKYLDRDIDSKLAGYIEKVPRIGGKLETQRAAFKSWLNSNYGDIDYEEATGKLSLKKEGKLVFNDKNKEHDIDALAKQWADEAGISVTDNRHQRPNPDKGGGRAVDDTPLESIDRSDMMSSWLGQKP